MDPVPMSSQLQDLVDAGLLKLPADAEGTYAGVRIKARIESDGSFTWKDQSFASPSVAAGVAITKSTGKTSYRRKYFSVNGWKFWEIRDGDGQTRTLTELRALLPPRRHP
jgi:hypothetical protein